MLACLRQLSARFFGDRRGSVLPIFAVAMVPLIGFLGAAVEYSKATLEKARLQSAIDAAVLAGANDGTTDWASVAEGVFRAAYPAKTGSDTPQFSSASNRYTGSASTTAATTLLTPLGYRSITVGAAATAFVSAPVSETSCILTLGKNATTDTNSLTFSGSPNVLLSGCNLRSDTSMKCNGHDTGALASISTGTTTNCSNPLSSQRAVPDIYKILASNITKKCTSSASNIRWSPGSPPSAAQMVTVYLADRTEYHVCGDLTLSGTGSLTGSSPALDTIIVIENGGLSMANNAAVSASRTTIVFTGNNTVTSAIDFPNGNGQSATLTLSPPTASTDPWAGMAIYQDPALTYRVDSTWGPGASLVADGIVYMPNASLSLGGNASSGSGGCTKIVANTVTMGGAVDVKQSAAACASLRVNQWATPKGIVITN